MSGRGRRRQTWTLWLLASLLPAACWAAALLAGVDPDAWRTISRPILRALVGDALLYNAACLLVAAPFAGVVVVQRQPLIGGSRGAFAAALSAAGPLAIAVGLLAGTSAGLTLLAAGANAPGVSFVLASHTTLAAVALALAMFGALCGRVFRDPLDAAAFSLGTVIAATGVLLFGGAAVADAPPALIGIAATANPLLVLASAAHVDLVREDVFYRLSPLAHMQFQDLSWGAASASYAAATALFFAGLALTYRTRRPHVDPVGALTREPAGFPASEDWL